MVDKLIVALPEVAHLAEKFHIRFHIHRFHHAHIGRSHRERARAGAAYHLIVEQEDIPVLKLCEVVHTVGLQEEFERFAIEAVLWRSLQSLKFGGLVPAHDMELVAVVFVFKEELRHIEGVAHHDLLAGYAHHALWRGLQVLKRIFHEVELRKWAWNGCARVARQSAVRVFDLANVVVAIWFHCNPVFRTGLGGLVVV